LIARQDGGVGDGQSERPSEKGGNGKPVGQPAYHGGFREGFEVGQLGITVQVGGGKAEQCGGGQKQGGGEAAAFFQAQPCGLGACGGGKGLHGGSLCLFFVQFVFCLSPERLRGLSTFSIQGGKQRLWVLSPARFVQAV